MVTRIGAAHLLDASWTPPDTSRHLLEIARDSPERPVSGLAVTRPDVR
ncbi:hypothetical protein [Streptomyces sp. NPDC047014]